MYTAIGIILLLLAMSCREWYHHTYREKFHLWVHYPRTMRALGWAVVAFEWIAFGILLGVILYFSWKHMP